MPLALAGGVQTRFGTCAAAITCPAVTATPESRRLPSAGSVVTITDCSAFAGVSLGSVKPKFAAENVCAVSSLMVSVALVPAGASFTAVMVKPSVAVAVSDPSESV